MLKHANLNIGSIPLLKSIERFEQCASLARLDETCSRLATCVTISQKVLENVSFSIKSDFSTTVWTLL